MERISIAVLALLFIFGGMLIGQHSHLNLTLFFTPWHPDDFWALQGFKSFIIVRPVSSNLLRLLGSFGETIYYSLFALICFSSLLATQMFVLKILRLNITLLVFLCFAATGSAIWFSQPQASQNLQYLGLMTNTLSYLFGMVAALLILQSGQEKWLSKKYIIYFTISAVFIFLSAFSKEDMVLFLIVCVVFSSLSIQSHPDQKPAVVKHLFAFTSTIVMIYGSSFLFSKSYASPFTSGKGAYDTSNLLINLYNNILFYLTDSKGVLLLYSIFVLTSVVSVFFSRRSLINKSFLVGSVTLLVCSFSLMAPYLVLPRKFSYYAMNFVPILTFSIAPLLYAIANQTLSGKIIHPRSDLFAIVFSIVLAFAFYHLDKSNRNYIQLWLENVRDRSLTQIQEVNRALDFGLRECNLARVDGVSNEFGPFLSHSEKYINNKIGFPISWRITATPGTRAGNFNRAHSSGKKKWTYINKSVKPTAADCVLEFNPKTLRAALKHN